MTGNELITPDLTDAPAVTGERADLLAALAQSRHFLRLTTRDLTTSRPRSGPPPVSSAWAG
ncbi:hypothetical protein AB0B54_08165 [Microbispora bryophytorum]|uniref:hypothetical protein n=1 Tax=Microbispora bryophytorum TaxID=1460882 RepID=UPI0034104A88